MKKKWEVRYFVTAVASIPVYKAYSKTETYRQAAKDGWGTFARLPITVYSKRSNAAIDYAALVEEYLEQLWLDGVSLLSVRPVTESDTQKEG